MAESKKFVVELEVLEREWVKKAVELQRTALMRSRAKEIAGAEIWTLRGREIEVLTGLLNRF